MPQIGHQQNPEIGKLFKANDPVSSIKIARKRKKKELVSYELQKTQDSDKKPNVCRPLDTDMNKST